jgi:hypothetical protein
MTVKEMRNLLAEQMALVRKDGMNIPQAESIANLAGKTIKSFQLELQAEVLRSRNEALNVVKDILG